MAVIYEFKALTDVWTGSVGKNTNRCIPTGLLGSIRWWFEVLVRGLDGNACDPSSTQCKYEKHCVVCELFGCTGLSRKFRFEVLDAYGKIKKDQIKEKDIFSFRFTELRPILDEEWALLDATLRLISGYGAIGGKTVLKPSNENNKEQHKDYGLINLENAPFHGRSDIEQLKIHLNDSKWQKIDANDFKWASLNNFWCVNGKYLSRQDNNTSTFNCVIGRPDAKEQSSQNDSWLAGFRPDRRNNIDAESKKVFSFKNPPRTFGFVKPGIIDFNAMKQRLENVWKKDGWEFLSGDKILTCLFNEKEKNL